MDSELIFKLESKLIPFPKKLFSLTPKKIDEPVVPNPAPAITSPVGFSSTKIFIILRSSDDPSIISELTFLKKFKLFKLLIDFVFKISL